MKAWKRVHNQNNNCGSQWGQRPWHWTATWGLGEGVALGQGGLQSSYST